MSGRLAVTQSDVWLAAVSLPSTRHSACTTIDTDVTFAGMSSIVNGPYRTVSGIHGDQPEVGVARPEYASPCS